MARALHLFSSLVLVAACSASGGTADGPGVGAAGSAGATSAGAGGDTTTGAGQAGASSGGNAAAGVGGADSAASGDGGTGVPAGGNDAGASGAAGLAGAAGATDAFGGGENPGDAGSAGSAGSAPIDATLTGVVHAPNGTIPISGALVYLAPFAPKPIPDANFCDKCVEIADTTPYTLTKPDGSFSLPAPSGAWTLVVQKGAFRRARPYTVVPGPQTVPAELTRFPGKTDAANDDFIPKLAIIPGAWDKIEKTLGKLGIQQFDSFENKFPPNLSDPTAPYALLHDPALLNKYNVLFVPCSSASGGSFDDPTAQCKQGAPEEAKVRKNLQEFVAAGGKLYSTDYQYEYMRRPWPGYVTWNGETSESGSACKAGEYTAPAVVGDDGLQAWLGAQSIDNFDLEANYLIIDKVNTVQGLGLDGNPASITPKVWMKGSINGVEKPTTVSFEHGCGRVMYSTYHTEDKKSGSGLLPQELALLYIILEVNVCIGPGVVR
jgi:hypothetical protein